jgi:hypothetical protein
MNKTIPAMTPNELTADEEEKFSRKLEFYLRSTGHLFPVTPAQVEAFEEYMASHPDSTPLPEFKLSAEEILKRGYVEYAPKAKPIPAEDEYGEGFRAAARNKGELTVDIIKKMLEDEEKEKKKKLRK